ncbi:MAG: hypothetical protein AB8H80_08125 [Planctomycetota bacterium]
MSKHAPDHHDADLVIKLYDLRREAVMRESRDAINGEWWPKNEAEMLAVMAPDHSLNRAFRQVGTYWEMVYGMAKHGVVNAEFLLENTGEGMLLYAKVEPYLAAIRKHNSRAFVNAEWMVENVEGDVAAALLARFRGRIAQMVG